MGRTAPVLSEHELVEKYQYYAKALVGQMKRSLNLPAQEMDDLLAAAYVGLVEAAKRFNQASNACFESFAYLRIRGAVIDWIRDNSQLTGKTYKIARAMRAACDLDEAAEIARRPSSTRSGDVELASLLEQAAQGLLVFKLSLEDVCEEREGMTSPDQGAEAALMEHQDKALLRKLLTDLPERERYVLHGYYIEGRGFHQLVDKKRGLSKSWISRLHARGIAMLRELYVQRIKMETGEEVSC